MPTYLFHLGREPHISTAEIEAVFSAWGTKYTVQERTAERLIIETKQPLDAAALMHRLGGTIKIAEQITSSEYPLPNMISHLTHAQPVGKIDFAVNDRRLALELKKELKTAGHTARFITIKNTATILFNRLVEKQSDLTVLGNQIYVTRAIQPIVELGARDYGRPGSDAKSGMLPPKLAKIMINLAQIPLDANILDPFCGSGTILMEAAAMGYKHLTGSDLSPKAIADTKKNLNWLITHYSLPITHYKIHQADARSLDHILKPRSIDAIITEPYLGKPLTGRESKPYLLQQTKDLAALYTAAFASFAKILKPNGVIIFITPAFKHRQEWITLDDSCGFVTKIRGHGFQPSPLLDRQLCLRYHRLTQRLARDIWRFKN